MDVLDYLYDVAIFKPDPRGSAPHNRVRVRPATNTRRVAVSNLPLDCYDQEWWSSVEDLAQYALRPRPEANLPYLVFPDGVIRYAYFPDVTYI